MKKSVFFAAGAAALALAGPASAAATLTFASVTGPTGTVWDTDSSTSFYALFLQQPFGNVINPNDNFSGDPTAEGPNNFGIAGDGFPAGTSTNSDPIYNLTLRFADGAQLTGSYVSTSQTFTGSSTTVGNILYTLTGFQYDRGRADLVSPYRAVEGGDPFDYTGKFAFSAVSGAVPEPTTWALFILGFGMVGGALRRRSSSVRVSKAKLNFA